MSGQSATAELTRRVRSALAELHPGSDISGLRTLEGGHSGLTFVVGAGENRYVVKAVPDGRRPIGRNDVLRQARLLTRLAGRGVPVPGVALQDVAEPAWFAMTFAPGEAVEPVLDEHDLAPQLAASRMRRAAVELARLHALPVAELGIGDVDPLTPEGELERWARTMQAVPPEIAPGGIDLVAALRRQVPAGIEPTLVHGDFRLANFLFDGEEPTALVDWEIWGVGDRRVDLGWFMVFVDAGDFPGVGREIPGLPSEDQLLSLYSPDGPPADMPWFRALGRMKMAAIMGHNLKRHREGKHVDPVQERLPPTIARLIASSRELLARP